MGFRIHLLISYHRVPLAFSVANADIDEREVLWVMSEKGDYRLIIADRGCVLAPLSEMLLELDGNRLLAAKP